MRGAITPLPEYVFIAWRSVKKAQGQLYLYDFKEYTSSAKKT
jgi:hypothetical protein